MSHNPDLDPTDEAADGVSGPAAREGRTQGAATPEGWERLETDVEGSKVSVLALSRPGSDNGLGSRPVLRERPAIASDVEGRPVLSLTLLLERRPRPHEESIRPLVERAVLRFDSTLAVTIESLRTLECSTADVFDPLYATRAEISLVATGDADEATKTADVAAVDVLDDAITTGTNLTASLGATLDREHALAVFDALSGRDGPLAVRFDVRYRPPSLPRTVRLRGSWSEIFDTLEELIPETGEYDRVTLWEAFRAMVERSVVDIGVEGVEDQTGTNDREGAAVADVEAAFALFVKRSAMVLRRFDDDEADVRFFLGARPPDGVTMRVSETIDAAPERTLRLEANLGAVLRGVLDGRDVDAHVSAVAIDGEGEIGDLGPILERVETRSAVADLAGGESRDAGRSAKLAVDGSTVTTVGRLISPSDRPSLPPRTGESVAVSGPRHLVFDDLRLPSKWSSVPDRSLPVVNRSEPPIWPDSLDASRRWYAPTFEPIPVTAGADPETGPFEFAFERTGTTADGEPALRGTLRFDLEATIPEAVAAELDREGNRRADPVAIDDLRADLLVPYEDDDGPRTQRLRADVTRDGDRLTVEVHLRNQWVRLAYGALAIPGFQDRRSRVVVEYTYEGYERVGPEPIWPGPIDLDVVPIDLDVSIGTKTAVTPVVGDRTVVGPRPETSTFFDPKGATLNTTLGQLRFGTSEAGGGIGRSGIVPITRTGTTGEAAQSGAGARSAGRSVTSGLLAVPTIGASDLVVRPPLKEAGEVSILPVPVSSLAVRTFGRSVAVDLSYPCADVGTLYRERTERGVEAIGCRDAFALGKTSNRQYEELSSLRHDRYRVYRALAQPHRFLVVPRTYRIGRRPPGTRREYEPTAVVYATLDVDRPEASKVIFEAGLQADIPPHVRLALRERLREDIPERGPEPILEYPTEVFERATYRWTIESAFDEPTVVETVDHLEVAVRTGLYDAHLLRTMLETGGIAARATFEMTDGTTVSSTIAMELDAMTGPWRGGAVAVDQLADGVRLTNRVGNELSVSAIQRYDDGRLATSIDIERTLLPGESKTVESSDLNAESELVAVYEERPGEAVTIEESRIYVEDITTNVIFVTDFDRTSRGVSSVEVRARLRGVDGTRVVRLRGDVDTPLSGYVEFTLPLTRYLDEQVLEFRVWTHADGEELDTGWLERDLRRDGTVIPLSWTLVSDEVDERGRRDTADDDDHRSTDGVGVSESNVRSGPRTTTYKR
ncbi:hypothetical protein [Natronorarus salvus]|uniref:hypothetical protein n=1 Tax=Natronorarus salvus TaxID=3117733 RepID=UPI002F25FDC8